MKESQRSAITRRTAPSTCIHNTHTHTRTNWVSRVYEHITYTHMYPYMYSIIYTGYTNASSPMPRSTSTSFLWGNQWKITINMWVTKCTRIHTYVRVYACRTTCGTNAWSFAFAYAFWYVCGYAPTWSQYLPMQFVIRHDCSACRYIDSIWLDFSDPLFSYKHEYTRTNMNASCVTNTCT